MHIEEVFLFYCKSLTIIFLEAVDKMAPVCLVIGVLQNIIFETLLCTFDT